MLLRFKRLGMEWSNIKTNQSIGVMRLPILKAFVVRDMGGCERRKVVLSHIVRALWDLHPPSAATYIGGRRNPLRTHLLASANQRSRIGHFRAHGTILFRLAGPQPGVKYQHIAD